MRKQLPINDKHDERWPDDGSAAAACKQHVKAGLWAIDTRKALKVAGVQSVPTSCSEMNGSVPISAMRGIESNFTSPPQAVRRRCRYKQPG